MACLSGRENVRSMAQLPMDAALAVGLQVNGNKRRAEAVAHFG